MYSIRKYFYTMLCTLYRHFTSWHWTLFKVLIARKSVDCPTVSLREYFCMYAIKIDIKPRPVSIFSDRELNGQFVKSGG